jgi:hypothetical protein
VRAVERSWPAILFLVAGLLLLATGALLALFRVSSGLLVPVDVLEVSGTLLTAVAAFGERGRGWPIGAVGGLAMAASDLSWRFTQNDAPGLLAWLAGLACVAAWLLLAWPESSWPVRGMALLAAGIAATWLAYTMATSGTGPQWASRALGAAVMASLGLALAARGAGRIRPSSPSLAQSL